MKPIRLELEGLRLRPLLREAHESVVLLTEGGEERYAVVPADDPDGRDELAAAERRARKRLTDPGRPATVRKRFSLDDQKLELADLLATVDGDAVAFLTADGRVRFVLIALGGADEAAVTAEPVARRVSSPRYEDDRPRSRGRDVRERPERPRDPGLVGAEWVLYPLLFFVIPAAGVVVSSVLYYVWKADRPRSAGQVNALGFAVFGVHVMLAICVALVVGMFGGTPAPQGQANLGPNPPRNNFPVNNPPVNNPPVNQPPPKDPPVNLAKFENQAMPGVEAMKPPEKADAASGLLAYWSFDEGEGDRPFNSGFAKQGEASLHNCRWVVGKRGNAVEFDGSSSWCDLVGDAGMNFAKGDDITVSAWVKATGRWGSVFMFRNRKDGGPAVCLAVENGSVVVLIREDGGEARSPALIKGPQINDGQWRHVILSRSIAEDRVSLYLDGKLLSSMQASTHAATGPITTDLSAAGWERYWGLRNQSPERQHFRGSIDEVCIYKRSLTAEEIATLAAGGKPPGSR